jgi:hypothetical protein
LPRLRRQWTAGNSGWGFSGEEREAIFEHMAGQAADAAEHVRRRALGDPALAADAVYATADALHVAARVTGSRIVRHAADAYDRAARPPYGRIPCQTRHGHQLRAAARMLALTGSATNDNVLMICSLILQLAALAAAVAELRQIQQHAAQAAAARATAGRLHAAYAVAQRSAPRPGQMPGRATGRMQTVVDVANRDQPTVATARPSGRAAPSPARSHPARGPLPRRRAGPGR